MSTPDEATGFSAAAVSHIERVLVEENQRLRKETIRLQREAQERALDARCDAASHAELARLRSVAATITWDATTLEEAQILAQQMLEGAHEAS